MVDKKKIRLDNNKVFAGIKTVRFWLLLSFLTAGQRATGTVRRKSTMKECMDSENLHRRIKKIIGQLNAIDRMIEEDVPCEDVLSQMNAVKSAVHKCGQVVLEGHIKHCVREGLEHGDPEQTIEKFTKAVERFANMK